MIKETRKAAWKSGGIKIIKQLHNVVFPHYAIVCLFLLVSVLSQALFTLVCRHLMSFLLFPAGHS